VKGSRRDSSVSTVTRLRAGLPGFDSGHGQRIFPFATTSKPALGFTQLLTQWVPGALSPGVKPSGRETDHSSPSSAEVQKAWGYTSTSTYVFMAWCLIKHSMSSWCDAWLSTGTTLSLPCPDIFPSPM
jgi:hypothetical protein